MGLEMSFVAVAVLVIALLASTFRILREYERGVVFQLGRFWKVKGPGLILIIPGIQQMVRVDLTEDLLSLSPAVCGGTMEIFVEAISE